MGLNIWNCRQNTISRIKEYIRLLQRTLESVIQETRESLNIRAPFCYVFLELNSTSVHRIKIIIITDAHASFCVISSERQVIVVTDAIRKCCIYGVFDKLRYISIQSSPPIIINGITKLAWCHKL